MAQTVSNDALWQKLSEMDKKLDKLSEVRESPIPILKQQIESGEPQKPDDSCFNFKFFKVRKTSFVISILGLLVFILTMFCMKQQNDYSLLMNEYYKQNMTIQKLNEELKVFDEKQRKTGVGKNTSKRQNIDK